MKIIIGTAINALSISELENLKAFFEKHMHLILLSLAPRLAPRRFCGRFILNGFIRNIHTGSRVRPRPIIRIDSALRVTPFFYLSCFSLSCPALYQVFDHLFLGIFFPIPSTTVTAPPSAYVVDRAGSGRCLSVHESAFAADHCEAVLGLRLIFAEESVENPVVPMGLD